MGQNEDLDSSPDQQNLTCVGKKLEDRLLGEGVKAKIQDKNLDSSPDQQNLIFVGKKLDSEVSGEVGQKKESGDQVKGLKDLHVTFGQYITKIKGDGDVCPEVAEATSIKDVSFSFDEYISSVKRRGFKEPTKYVVTPSFGTPWSSPVTLCLETLLPMFAAPPPSFDGSGIDLPRECPCPPSEDEFEEVETISWEKYLREQEEMKEKEKEKEKLNEQEKGQEKSIGVWDTYLQLKKEREEKGRTMEALWKEAVMKKGLEQMGREKAKLRVRKTRTSLLDDWERRWARADELGRSCRALLST